MRDVIFIVGAPGVGKTSIVRELLEADPYFTVKPKWTVCEHVCAAGHYTGGTFDGADTVPYNGVKACLEFWKANLRDKKLTIFDGDRFSYAGTIAFFEGIADARCVHVVAPESVVEARRKQRGSNQNATWLKGRVSKAKNFASLFQNCVTIEATKPASELAEEVRRALAQEAR